MLEKQKTVKIPVTISGVGLHTGKEVTLTFKPAPINHGYKFKRIDLEGEPIVNVDIDNVIDFSRGTTIEENGVRINTVEHTLAALAGLGLDNVIIELNCSETPILDGSSAVFVEALLKAGFVEQDADKKYYRLTTNITYNDPERDVELIAMPSENFQVSAMIDYNSSVLKSQFAYLNKIEDFKDEIAPCRTFVFLHELEQLIAQNLIKGGDLNNAIVIVDKPVDSITIEKLSKIFNKPGIEVKKEGILNNVDLYFNNEPARHKLLDIVGDLALVGMPVKAKIIARKPGHKANLAFAKKIKEQLVKDKLKKIAPVYDPDAPPLFDINQISKILPHRHPFLLIDKIIEMSDTHIVGLKNVTMNEAFFTGHFPGNPVMPGVLNIEAMAQTGGVMALCSVSNPEAYNTYFLKIDNVRFKNRVIPGDTIIYRLDLISPIRRGICHMKGVAYVGNKIVIEAELMAQIVKK
ncbi:MAG: bifunctional UDP-3-O-[3-hydroxymyristoyl] N-acetylglucosamine deacetylase/3-hydroxyacyl-ACP dehydratase [Bacteroidota bacterium]|nr:bifunctional UDP-3-O-[3-hydroxymyristoyl] N-acetylglucosamine deacetylase/3-hydroxyacyl-ACP dehydratase [Bacteroidota bacterium]